jgi:hypothetical protein
MVSIAKGDAATSRNCKDGSPAGLRVRVHGAIQRGALWTGVGGVVSATAIGIGACKVVDSCADDGTCPPTLARGYADPTGGDPDASSEDSCAGDGGCSTLAEASDALNPDGHFGPSDGGACTAPNDALGAGCTADDADGGSATEGGSTVDASIVGQLLGAWTLVGTERYACSGAAGLSPDASATTDAVTATVTFRAGPTDAGPVDMWFDAGIDCALALSVDGSSATLVSPQPCALQGPSVNREFTSVHVVTSTGSLRLTEEFTDRIGCQYEVQGELTR